MYILYVPSVNFSVNPTEGSFTRGMTDMGKKIDLTGQVFGRLTVLGVAGKDKRGSTLWECSCSCGQRTTALAYQLRSGSKKSCGCLSREKAKNRLLKHGEWGTRLHQLWKGVKDRCNNPNNINYKNYGGRGIRVCSEGNESFLTFKEFMLSIGQDETVPTGEQTIERIDVNVDYEPSNCTLITKKEQNYNKRNNHLVTYKGEIKTISEFAEEYGLEVENLFNRVNYFGYTIEEAIEKPVRKAPHSNAPKYEVDGESHTMREWAELLGMTRSQLKSKARHRTVEEVVRKLKEERS